MGKKSNKKKDAKLIEHKRSIISKFEIDPRETVMREANSNFTNLFYDICATFLQCIESSRSPGAFCEAFSQYKDHYKSTFSKAPEMITFHELGNKRIACRKGCSYCCTMRVTVHPIEAITIFRKLIYKLTIEEKEVLLDSLRKYERDRSGLIPNEIILLGQTCPFLQNHLCSIYEFRPITCIDYHSFDLQACIDDAENPDDGIVVISDHSRKIVTGIYSIALEYCCNKLGLQNLELEFIPSLIDLFSDDSIIDCYFSGKNPFTLGYRPDITTYQKENYPLTVRNLRD